MYEYDARVQRLILTAISLGLIFLVLVVTNQFLILRALRNLRAEINSMREAIEGRLNFHGKRIDLHSDNFKAIVSYLGLPMSPAPWSRSTDLN